jgi:SAM-dependent methyltransferase
MSPLAQILHAGPPRPWEEGGKIPWNDPGFSARMLQEHLSQEHDLASRRFETIDRQVSWIHSRLLGGRSSRILDLGCGPGFYCSRLASLDHECVGIDFAPASIEYATEQARREGLSCTYYLGDLRAAEFGGGFDLAMLIYGEFNVFRRSEVKDILLKAASALTADGLLLLEPQSDTAIHRVGRHRASWYRSEKGLFSEKPHICLQENFWLESAQVAIQRFFVIDAATTDVTMHSITTQAYTDDELLSLLTECGFVDVRFLAALDDEQPEERGDLFVIIARKTE